MLAHLKTHPIWQGHNCIIFHLTSLIWVVSGPLDTVEVLGKVPQAGEWPLVEREFQTDFTQKLYHLNTEPFRTMNTCQNLIVFLLNVTNFISIIILESRNDEDDKNSDKLTAFLRASGLCFPHQTMAALTFCFKTLSQTLFLWKGIS